ncbi:hypothetical protein, partial [Syntrophomonas wolfei]|uniref:hypothetical protein n=1 Tax=Syntrophomonas wolfei TaxID=863 RepID=UPI0023F2E274
KQPVRAVCLYLIHVDPVKTPAVVGKYESRMQDTEIEAVLQYKTVRNIPVRPVCSELFPKSPTCKSSYRNIHHPGRCTL